MTKEKDVERVHRSLVDFERVVNSAITETLSVIEDQGASERTLLLQVLRNQVTVFAALSDLYRDVEGLLRSKP